MNHRHDTARLRHYVEANVLCLLFGSGVVSFRCGNEVDPLEYFATFIVVELALLMDVDVAFDFSYVRFDVRDGAPEPPLDLVISSEQLRHWLLLLGSGWGVHIDVLQLP